MIIAINKNNSIELDPSELGNMTVKFTLFHGRRFSYKSKSDPKNSFKDVSLNQLISAVAKASYDEKQDRIELMHFIQQFSALENKGYDCPNEGIYKKSRWVQSIIRFKHQNAQNTRVLLLDILSGIKEQSPYQVKDGPSRDTIGFQPTQTGPNPLYDLPIHVREKIFGSLDYESLVNLSLSSKQNCQLVEENLKNKKFQALLEYKALNLLKNLDFEEISNYKYSDFYSAVTQLMRNYPEVKLLLQNDLKRIVKQGDQRRFRKFILGLIGAYSANPKCITSLLEQALLITKKMSKGRLFYEDVYDLANFFAKQDPQRVLEIANLLTRRDKEKLICKLVGSFIPTDPNKSFELLANVTDVGHLLTGLRSILAASSTLEASEADAIVQKVNAIYQLMGKKAVAQRYNRELSLFLQYLHKNYLILQQSDNAERISKKIHKISMVQNLLWLVEKFPQRFGLLQAKILESINQIEELDSKQNLLCRFNVLSLTYFSDEKPESFKELSRNNKITTLIDAAKKCRTIKPKRSAKYLEEALKLLLKDKKKVEENSARYTDYYQHLASIVELYAFINPQKSKELLNQALKKNSYNSYALKALTFACFYIDQKYAFQIVEDYLQKKRDEIVNKICFFLDLSEKLESNPLV